MVEVSEPIEPREGVVIAGWTLRRQLGKGGMGQVWKVDRPTAAGPAELAVMKLPLSNGIEDASTLRRAGLEAKAMYLLQGCPNVLQIKDMGVYRDVLFYVVMEYVHGADLGEVIRVLRRRREKLAPETAAWIAGEIGAGLKAVHNLVIAGVPQNLRHLDIALKNILVSTAGQVKIGDFGLASGTGDPELTNRGSYKYMAPEHLFGVPSQQSDIFSLGVVLWELLERDHYRVGSNAAELRGEITSGNVREIRRSDVSEQLAALVHDCLRPNEAARPSIDQFMVRLERVPEYRMQRSTVAELIARCFERLRTSGHTEVLMRTVPAASADIAGLMAASEVLIAAGTTLALSEVFRGVPKPKAAHGYVSPRGSAAEGSDDAPAPPGMFGAPDEAEAEPAGAVDPVVDGLRRSAAAGPVAPAVGPAPQLRTVSLEGEAGAGAALDRTTQLPDAMFGLAMGPPPTDGNEMHRPGPASFAAPRVMIPAAVVAPAPAAAAAPATMVAAEGEPSWPVLADQRAGTGPRPALVLPTDRFTPEAVEARPPVWQRMVVVLPALALLAIVLGTAMGMLIGSNDDGDDASATTRAAQIVHAQPEARKAMDEPVRSGPVLHPVEPMPVIEPTAAVAPEVPPEVPPVVPRDVAPVVTPDVAPEVTPTSADVPAAATKAEAKPKPKPAPVVMVPLEVRNTLVKPGIEVMIGKKQVRTTGSARLEIAAGRHRVKWREVGTTAWIDAGKFDFSAKHSHLLVIGKISYPNGVRHVPQELR